MLAHFGEWFLNCEIHRPACTLVFQTLFFLLKFPLTALAPSWADYHITLPPSKIKSSFFWFHCFPHLHFRYSSKRFNRLVLDFPVTLFITYSVIYYCSGFPNFFRSSSFSSSIPFRYHDWPVFCFFIRRSPNCVDYACNLFLISLLHFHEIKTFSQFCFL